MPCPTTAANRRLTVDERDEENNVQTKPSRPPCRQHPTTHTTCTTIHLNVRSIHSSLQSSRRTSISHRVKYEDSTNTYSSATEDLEDAADDERQHGLQNHRSNCKSTFFHPTESAKDTVLSSIVPSNERYDRLMSYHYYCLTDTIAKRTSTITIRLYRALNIHELTTK